MLNLGQPSYIRYGISHPALKGFLRSTSHPSQKPPPQPKTLARVGQCERMDRAKRIPANRLIQLPKLQAWPCINSNRDAHHLAHSTSIMNEVKITYYPARPLLTSTLTFTRRFSARPDADSLLAMGSALPIAPGATMWRTGMLHFSVR
jgi:hypothetical protein